MKYLVVEGPDFSGKSSLIKELERRLTASGHPVELVFEPGGTQYANHLRHIMLDAEYRNSVGIEEAPCAEAELFAMLSARADLVHRRVLPALAEGKIVISDRGSPSTDVYQCHDEPLRAIFRRYKPLAVPITPLYVFLTIDYDTYAERRAKRDAEKGLDEIEKRYVGRSRFEALAASYRQAALREQNAVHIDVVGKTVEQVADEVMPYVISEARELQ